MNWVYTLDDLVDKNILNKQDISEDKLPNYVIVPFMHKGFKRVYVHKNKSLGIKMVSAVYVKVIIKKNGKYIDTFYILEEIEAAAKDVKTLPNMLQKYDYLPKDDEL